MHISDGVLPPAIWISGYVVTAGISAISLRKMDVDDVPKVAVVTASFFVASLLHVKFGPTSVHLILNGFAGVLLGWTAFASILVGLALQAFLFGHGGITSLGVNAIMMGLPAIAAYQLFRLHSKFSFKVNDFLFGFLAGFFGVFFGTIILAILLAMSGEQFFGVAKLAAIAHLPVMIIEGIITGFVVSFLKRVKPEILEGSK
ncbi:TPA: cobalt transporter CbiM [Candidatus Poribacteria bacterium]|nr:cobalt transporter CbiM [Candidatus Poribacteria bacterium]